MFVSKILSFESSEGRFCIIYWLRPSKKSKWAIYCRITLAGKRWTFSTGQFSDLSNWDCLTYRTRHDAAINRILQIIEDRARLAVADLSSTNKPVSLHTLRFQLGVDKKRNIPSLMDLAHQYVAESNQRYKAKQISLATFRHIVTRSKNVKLFLSYQFQRSDIPLSEITPAIGSQLYFYFFTICQFGEEHTRKLIQFAALLLQSAYQHEYLSRNPLAGFKLKKAKNKPIFSLTDSELQLLEKVDLLINELSVSRDLYIFCCYTALAYVDVMSLRRSHLVTRPDGQIWIVIQRTKTNVTSFIPLFPPAARILNKYQNHPECTHTGSLLPFIRNDRVNKHIKEAALLAGIQRYREIHFHTARKRAATWFLNEGYTLETVALILGHNNTKLTATKYAQLKEKRVAEETQAFMLRMGYSSLAGTINLDPAAI